jgi:N utilization substance protein B
MRFVADVPPIVSINEAVGIARDYSGDKSGNFINGVLNGLKDTLTRPARDAVKEL